MKKVETIEKDFIMRKKRTWYNRMKIPNLAFLFIFGVLFCWISKCPKILFYSGFWLLKFLKVVFINNQKQAWTKLTLDAHCWPANVALFLSLCWCHYLTFTLLISLFWCHSAGISWFMSLCWCQAGDFTLLMSIGNVHPWMSPGRSQYLSLSSLFKSLCWC